MTVSFEVYWNSHAAEGEGPSQPTYFQICTADRWTREEVEADIASAPKGCRFHVVSCSGSKGHTFYAITSGKLLADGANGGKNETGVKRIATCLRWAGQHATVTERTQRVRNSYKSLDEIRAALDI